MIRNIQILIDQDPQKIPEEAGDWWFSNGTLYIRSTDLGSSVSAIAVAVHELTEAFLCQRDGIKEEDVSQFDREWYEAEKIGIQHGHEEPGDDPVACITANTFPRSMSRGHLWRRVAELGRTIARGWKDRSHREKETRCGQHRVSTSLASLSGIY